MFTIVAVYSGHTKTFDRLLKASLEKQSVSYELVAVDNIDNRNYSSAAEAFNIEAANAKGDYIMFIHQDIELEGSDWLKRAEEYLNSLPELGAASIMGVDREGKFHGYFSDCGVIFGTKIEEPVVARVFDEIMLIIPKKVWQEIKFDEKNFDHWHMYVVDYCLNVERHQLKSYVLPLFVYHRSLRKTVKSMEKYKRHIYYKYGGPIYTTLGVINLKSTVTSFIKDSLGLMNKRFYPQLPAFIKRETAGTESILDLNCGYNSVLQHLSIKKRVGVDPNPAYIEESSKKLLHDSYVNEDVRTVSFPAHSFEVVLADQLLGQLTKAEAESLMQKMEPWASKKIIITTLNGFSGLARKADPSSVANASLWRVKDFSDKGYRVYGTGGLRVLRHSTGNPKYRFVIWPFVSDFFDFIAYHFPSFAFSLIAVKDVVPLQSQEQSKQ